MAGASKREALVGLVVIAALATLLGLVVVANGGPGFLASRRSLDVVFRDAQGIRAGSPVRIAGLDAGRVEAVGLAEVDGKIHARLRLSIPKELAAKLRQDVKVTIQAGLIGQGSVNIVDAGRSGVALVPGQTIRGVETTVFDPILDQVGLGPVERNELSRTITEVRKTVSEAAPRIRQIMASLQASANGFRETSEAIRPSVVAAAGQLDDAVRKVQTALVRVDTLLTRVDGLVSEAKPDALATLKNVRTLTATVQDIAAKDRVKVEALLDGAQGTRARLDKVLANTDALTGQANGFLTRNRADIERTIANGKEISAVVNLFVQKLNSNPAIISPLYKPRPEDIRAQAVTDSSTAIMAAAKELGDSIRTVELLRNKPMTASERDYYDQMMKQIAASQAQIDRRLSELAQRLGPMGTRR